MSDPAVRERLAQLKAMPGWPLPRGAAMAITRLSWRPAVTLPVVAHAIKADPVFSLRLIKVATGVGGATQRPVVSLRDAVTVLGLAPVRALALGFSLQSNYSKSICRDFDQTRFWNHSLVRAVALQVLTGVVAGHRPEQAFSLGLLARGGELALASLFPQQYADILRRKSEQPALCLCDLEQEAFGLTHEVLTASILLDCGLSPDHGEPAACLASRELPSCADGSRQVGEQPLLALADYLGDVCLAPRSEWRRQMPTLFDLGEQLSLDAATLIPLCDRVAHEWREWAALLDLESGPLPHFEPPCTAPAVAVDQVNGMCVLVVGDEMRVRNPLIGLLTAAGHQVFEAATGRQGLAMAIELQPPVMLVDALAADMDGIELTQTLRQSKIGRGIYVLVLSATEDEDELVAAFEAGADDFLVMPAPARVLAARLRAGQRAVGLQQELLRDQEEIQRISAELSVTNQQLREVGMTDLLTGCPNRRHAMDRIQQEWAMTTRSQRPLACMLINMDHFKKINDAHGHEAGDTVLKLVASALKDEIRAQDMLARSGGDEFLVICPDTTLEAAMACAERMREVVAALPIACDAQNARGSVSIGVAVRDATTVDSDALIRLADQGAYLAKRRHNAVATVQASEATERRSA